MKELIANAFRCCGLSLAINGSKDDVITCLKSPEFEAAREILRKPAQLDAQPPASLDLDLDYFENKPDHDEPAPLYDNLLLALDDMKNSNEITRSS